MILFVHLADNAVNWLSWACFLSHTVEPCAHSSLSCAMHGMQSGLFHYKKEKKS